MSDESLRTLERTAAETDGDEVAKLKASRERCRVEGCRHEYEGSACSSCEAPDPRTFPKGGADAFHRYGCRRWATDNQRPGEAFEVFDRVTGECKSFPGNRRAMTRKAHWENRWRRAHPSGRCEHADCPVKWPA